MSDSTDLHRRGPAATALEDDRVAAIGLVVLRGLVGLLLLVHGLQNSADPAGHIAAAEQLGVPLAPVTGTLSLVGEVGLGLLLLLGLLTRIAGALTAVLMGLTWLVSVLANGLVTDDPGITAEPAVLFAAAGVAFACLGGGRYALDTVLPEPIRRTTGLGTR